MFIDFLPSIYLASVIVVGVGVILLVKRFVQSRF